MDIHLRNVRGKKCFQCTDNHESEEEYNECKIVRCLHCQSIEHKSNSKDCEEYKRQKNIKEKMVFDNISFYEAAALFPKKNK